MPVVSEPWFEMPLAVEWKTEEGRTTVTQVEKYRVRIRGTPSVFGMPADVLKAMNDLAAGHSKVLPEPGNRTGLALVPVSAPVIVIST